MHLMPLGEPNYQGLGQRLDKTLSEFNKRKGTYLSNKQTSEDQLSHLRTTKTSLTQSSHMMAKARRKLREMRMDSDKHTRRLDLTL